MVHGTNVKQNEQDFWEVMALTMDIVKQKMYEAKQQEDFKQTRYLSGVLRGIEMCQESFKICLEQERSTGQQSRSFIAMEPPSQ